jgi:hypothetical protein
MSDFYLTTVSSKEADEKYVSTLTRVLIPIVVRLMDKIHPALPDDQTFKPVEPEPVEDEVLRRANKKGAGAVVIGPAGENLVHYAVIENDYYGWYEQCLQCGHITDLPDLTPRQPAYIPARYEREKHK